MALKALHERRPYLQADAFALTMLVRFFLNDPRPAKQACSVYGAENHANRLPPSSSKHPVMRLMLFQWHLELARRAAPAAGEVSMLVKS